MMNSQALYGQWTFVQTWSGMESYTFFANFNPDGTLSVTDDGLEFFGTYQILGASNQIALAIANFRGGEGSGPSISAYAGIFEDLRMSGEAQGGAMGAHGVTTASGTWKAFPTPIIAPEA